MDRPSIPMRTELVDALTMLQSRDPDKVGEAIALLQGTVFAFSMKVCGHREDAEDTMQDVLMRSLPHLAKIEEPRALAAWLYTVTRNRCWRSRRKGAHAPSETLSLDELMPDQPELQRLLADQTAGPEQNALHGEANFLLHRAVLSLPAQYRLVLVLHDMEDLDAELVANILGLQIGTVRVRLHRARLAVRKAMANLLNGEPLATPAANQHAKRKRSRKTAREAAEKPASCREIFANLSEYLDGRLKPATCAEMQDHIDACPACIAFIRDLSAAIDRCRAFQPACEPGVAARLTDLLAHEYLRLVAPPA